MNNEPLPAERRLDPRRVTDVKVFAHDGVELRKCRLRDISVNGAFIETKDFPLAKKADVELVLRIRREGRLTHCRLPAKVLRITPEGVALTFVDLDEMLAKIVFDIVNADQSEPQSDASY
ncbi:MAG: PilZ domain-containing protein [Acidiferrobacterales bacterium]|nr:PilZ domain-containing protein [Acidiferrobacterales bacterium]